MAIPNGARQANMAQAAEKHTKAPIAPCEDKLTKLPSEILHMIFDYVFCQHKPNKAFYTGDSTDIITSECSHDLDYLSATSKVLRSEMNDWAIHFLTIHKDITNFEMAKTTNKARTFNMLRGRKGLLTWAKKHCIFCGKTSSRRAILMNGFKCCHACDQKHWPDKITKTCARNEYQLKDHHLFPHLRTVDTHCKIVPRSKLPTIRYGTYMCAGGVATTNFSRKDVERLATALHGDLEVYFAKRKAAREAKLKKVEENYRTYAKDALDKVMDVRGDPTIIETFPT